MINLERFFWIKWRDSDRTEHVVGLFAKVKGKYYFKYNPELADPENLARKKGFKSIPYFGNVDVNELVVAESEIFDFLKERIPSQSDMDEWKACGLSEYDECEIIAVTQAKTKIDSFFLEEIKEMELKKVFNNVMSIER